MPKELKEKNITKKIIVLTSFNAQNVIREASELGISEKTVRNHISNVMQKLGVNGRAGAVVELLKLKELSL